MDSGATCHLNGVWGSSGNDVFSVGNYGTILHYNGTSWEYMDISTESLLSGIWGSSGSDVFAVGGAGTIQRYNGSTWDNMTSGTTMK